LASIAALSVATVCSSAAASARIARAVAPKRRASAALERSETSHTTPASSGTTSSAATNCAIPTGDIRASSLHASATNAPIQTSESSASTTGPIVRQREGGAMSSTQSSASAALRSGISNSPRNSGCSSFAATRSVGVLTASRSPIIVVPPLIGAV